MKSLKWNPENLWKTEFGKSKTEFHRALKFLFLLYFYFCYFGQITQP